MEFDEHKPIYLQIADTLCEKVLQGEWQVQERIPSVRELGIDYGVNPNTIMRVYEYLQNSGIIFNKRGIGYFVSADANELILKSQREQFFSSELPLIVKKLKLLNISIEELTNHINKTNI